MLLQMSIVKLVSTAVEIDLSEVFVSVVVLFNGNIYPPKMMSTRAQTAL